MKTTEPPRRMLIECSHTFYDGQNTGIQRVVRNLAAHGASVGAEQGLECFPVVWSPWGFIRMDRLPPRGRPAFRLIKAVARGTYHTLCGMASSGANNPPPLGEASVPAPVPRKPGFGRHVLVLLKRLVYSGACLLCHSPGIIMRNRVRLGPGDALLLADASWNQPMWSAVGRAKKRGCSVGVLLYDLIAIGHPEWFDRPLALNFSDWLHRAISTADWFVAISQATRDQLIDVAARDGVDLTHRSGAFPLGVDVPKPSAIVAPSQEIAAVFRKDRPVLLMVGTLEPRKNHALALDGFDRLAATPAGPTLLLIGRPGWRCQPIIDRITSHPQFNKRLFWIANASDGDLDFCYRHAALLLVPSLAEGFGLPIIEGLTRKLPVLCSDIPIFREVAGTHAAYAPLGDSAAWAASIAGFLAVPSRPDAFISTSWQESTRQLLRSAVRLAAQACNA